MPKRALTAAAVERIKPPATGQVDHFDKGYPGLALRVSYGGRRSWIYIFRMHGKLTRLTLGTWPAMELAEAREEWRNARKLVEKGVDPRATKAKEAEADTFEAVMADWLKRDQAHNRSHDEVKRILEKDVLPAWHGRRLAEIERREILDLIDGVADRGALTLARRVHAHLHRMFRWAVGRGILAANPMADAPKPGAEVKRDRVLSDDELVQVWNAAEEIGWPFGPAFKLLMLTGARRAEIGGLRWSELDLDAGEIRLEGERTKNGQPHTIPLALLARTMIEDLPRMDGSDYVFTTTGKTPVSGWSRAKRVFDEQAPLSDWRTHDLRRTVATGLQRLGVNLQVVEAVLGHVSGSRAGVVGIYQRYSFDTEKRAALERWAVHIDTILNGAHSNVVMLR